jgi:hypothetical protein
MRLKFLSLPDLHLNFCTNPRRGNPKGYGGKENALQWRIAVKRVSGIKNDIRIQ